MDGANNEILRRLWAMRSDIAAQTLLAQAKRLRGLAEKAGFRPDQARVPAGNPDGGRWADEGTAGASDMPPRLWLAGDNPELPPDVPPDEPPTVRERNGWGVRVAKYLVTTSPTLAGSILVNWLVNHAGYRIRAYLEPAKSLAELQHAALVPKPGFDIHHIVEQTPARQDGLPWSKIDGSDTKS